MSGGLGVFFQMGQMERNEINGTSPSANMIIIMDLKLKTDLTGQCDVGKSH